MTKRQTEKAASAALAAFEQQVLKGVEADKKLTLDGFLGRWFAEYAEKQLKPSTVEDYARLRRRVSTALGHLRIDCIRPAHLLEFYDTLEAAGAREDTKYTALPALYDALNGQTKKETAKAAGLAENTVRLALQGHNVTQTTARKLAAAAALPIAKAFKPVETSAKLTGNTANHYHRFLSSVFGTAVKWQLIVENPCARVSAPKIQQGDIQFLDAPDIARLMNALQYAPPEYSAIVQLALLTGARRGELCGLRWSDISFSNGTLAINRTLQRLTGQGLVFTEPKTRNAKRVIALGVDAVQLLDEWRKEQTRERLRAGGAWAQRVVVCGRNVKNDLVFTKPDGTPIDPDKATTWFPVFLRRHDLPPVRFHSLRHTNASLLIVAHVPITTVSGRLGHARTSTTTDIYSGFIRSSDAAAADTLDSVFDDIRRGG